MRKSKQPSRGRCQWHLVLTWSLHYVMWNDALPSLQVMTMKHNHSTHGILSTIPRTSNAALAVQACEAQCTSHNVRNELVNTFSKRWWTCVQYISNIHTYTTDKLCLQAQSTELKEWRNNDKSFVPNKSWREQHPRREAHVFHECAMVMHCFSLLSTRCALLTCSDILRHTQLLLVAMSITTTNAAANWNRVTRCVASALYLAASERRI